MTSFININKVKVLLFINNIIKYGAWTLFFILQGQAIELAVKRNSYSEEQLYNTLFLFLIIKLVVMVGDITSKYLVSYYQNEALKEKWQSIFPLNIYNDTESKSHLVYLLFFDHLPSLYSIECSIANNISLIISVCIIIATLMFYTSFYIGFIALAVVFILNIINRSIYRKKLDNSYKKTYKSKADLTNWLNQYFKAYRETSSNWHAQINDWSKDRYESFYINNKHIFKFQLLRDVIAQLLVEVPFVINTALIIIGVYFNYLSITQMFVWVGISQFVISASNAYLENKINYDKSNTLKEKIIDINQMFINNQNGNFTWKIDRKTIFNVTLLDGTENKISFKAGIYHIKGSNGTGKSTVLNTILNYERIIKNDKYEQLSSKFFDDGYQSIRVIERNAVIFSCIHTFDSQILGPINHNGKDCINLIFSNMKNILQFPTLDKLINIFEDLKNKYSHRTEKNFSSGETVMLSMMRVLASWSNTINIIIVDECTLFLDRHCKKYFIECLEQLSTHVAVFISSHEESILKPVSAEKQMLIKL